ncbi:MAG: von Willebrand factor type A domain-containing protein [Candidatus Zixiibacteriota bacterium]|nr:MAG: von Willebrand factor type A domain-containing protein [candidate division Zixibacteria bacterium]
MNEYQKRMVMAILVWLALAGVAGATDAGPAMGAVTGTVLNPSTGRPVEGVWVGLVGTNLGVKTDSLGRFTITDVPPSQYELHVSHPDYTDIQGKSPIIVTVEAGQTVTVAASISKKRGELRDLSSPSLPGVTYDYDQKIMTAREREGQQMEPASGDRVAGQGSADKHQDTESVPRSPAVYSLHGFPEVRKTKPAHPGCYDGDWYKPYPSDMFFQDYGTNDFIQTSMDRYSTFAIDVDDAAYSVVRQYLREGNLPPRDAVRVEEFVNRFDYGYNPPSHEKFRIFTELAPSPFDNGITLFKIGIKGREISRQERKPLNLTFVIDVSGSMGRGNRLELVKSSLLDLVAQLDGNDRIGIVAYGSNAYCVLEPISVDRKREIIHRIRSLSPGGSTYAEAGLRLGYEMANRQYVSGHDNVMILCSDGVANVGRTSADGIMAEVQRRAHKGITLSCFGFGMGNYNDVLLEQLAQRGNGRYAYINDMAEARRQFVDGFMGNIQVLGRDVKVQVDFNPSVVSSYRLLGYENRDVADHRFRDNNQDGGEVGAGHEITALYALRLTSKRHHGEVGSVFVRWTDSDLAEVGEAKRTVNLGSMSRAFERSRPEFRLAWVAATFGEILKGSRYTVPDYRRLEKMANRLTHELPGDQTRELAQLIRIASGLSSSFTDRGPHRLYPDDDSNYRR